MKKLYVNVTNASYKKLKVVAGKSGFVFFEGRKHLKVKTATGAFVTEIPRHKTINKHTAEGIVEAMIAHGAKIEFS